MGTESLCQNVHLPLKRASVSLWFPFRTAKKCQASNSQVAPLVSAPGPAGGGRRRGIWSQFVRRRSGVAATRPKFMSWEVPVLGVVLKGNQQAILGVPILPLPNVHLLMDRCNINTCIYIYIIYKIRPFDRLFVSVSPSPSPCLSLSLSLCPLSPFSLSVALSLSLPRSVFLVCRLTQLSDLIVLSPI